MLCTQYIKQHFMDKNEQQHIGKKAVKKTFDKLKGIYCCCHNIARIFNFWISSLAEISH